MWGNVLRQLVKIEVDIFRPSIYSLINEFPIGFCPFRILFVSQLVKLNYLLNAINAIYLY